MAENANFWDWFQSCASINDRVFAFEFKTWIFGEEF